MKKKIAVLIGLVLVISLTVYAIDIPVQTTTQDDTTLGDNGDSGTVEGHATIKLLDGKGNVIQGSIFSVIFSGIAPEPGDYDSAESCHLIPGFHWDGSSCVPNEDEPEVPAGDDPSVTVTTFDQDFAQIEFVLDWVEVEGYKASKAALFVKVKARVLLQDENWSNVLDDMKIKATENEFRFEDTGTDTWKARADEQTMQDNDLKIDKDELPSEGLFYPLRLRFYYYAKTTSLADNEGLQSNTLQTIVIIDAPGLSLGGQHGVPRRLS